MSRIGKLPIQVPENVQVELSQDNLLTIQGPKGSLTKSFVPDMLIEYNNQIIEVKRPSDSKKNRSLHGLTRTLIFNMVEGVSNGYKKTLEINGIGYRAQKNGNKLILNLGFSHPIEMLDPEGVTSAVEGNKITVSGIDKEKVGQYAAEIRSKRKPEPYKGKGIKYENELIRRKVGKAGKK